jgi:hypothetical protein
MLEFPIISWNIVLFREIFNFISRNTKVIFYAKFRIHTIWHVYKFCSRAATGSSKSGDPILHRESPHIKKRIDATSNLKKN